MIYVLDMERKQYLDQIHELVQTVQTLLDANIALGNKQKELQAEADRKIAGLHLTPTGLQFSSKLVNLSLQPGNLTI